MKRLRGWWHRLRCPDHDVVLGAEVAARRRRPWTTYTQSGTTGHTVTVLVDWERPR